MYIHIYIYSFKALVRQPQVLESEMWCRGQYYSKKRENVYFFLLLYHFERSKSKSECFHFGQLSSYIYIFLNACVRETLLTLTSKNISISKYARNFGFTILKWKWLKIMSNGEAGCFKLCGRWIEIEQYWYLLFIGPCIILIVE